MTLTPLTLTITPSGHLRLEDAPERQPAVSEATATALKRAFAESSVDGLLALATDELDRDLPVELVFWRGIARELFQRICHLGESAVNQWASVKEPAEAELGQLVAAAPPMRGLEYLTAERIGLLWRELRDLVVARATAHPQGPAAWLHAVNPLWH